MKEIFPDTPGIQPASPSKREDTGRIPVNRIPGGFARILAEELSDAGPQRTSDGDDPGLPELTATYTAQLAQSHPDTPLVPQMISQAVDLLETYAGILSDPEQTLKQAYAILEQIQAKSAEIDEGLNAAQDADPGLKHILDHLATVVELEKIKINRGDYS